MPTMTAAQRRDEAKEEFDAFLADCPSRVCSTASPTSG